MLPFFSFYIVSFLIFGKKKNHSFFCVVVKYHEKKMSFTRPKCVPTKRDKCVSICSEAIRVSKYFIHQWFECNENEIVKDDDDEFLVLPPRTPQNKQKSQLPQVKKHKFIPSPIMMMDEKNEFRYKRNVTHAMKIEVITRQHSKCNICQKDLNETLQVDHIIDLCIGGSNDPSNLQALCLECHDRKTKESRRIARIRRQTGKDRCKKSVVYHLEEKDLSEDSVGSPYF
jgi:hypothetical protein